MNPSFAYRASAVAGSSPVGLVVLLYEQLIEDLRCAVGAMRAQDVQKRSRELDHALQIVGQLQGTLNKEQGGEAARNLDRFYSLLRGRLLQAQLQISPEILREQIAVLLDLREAWLQLERQTNADGPARFSMDPSPSLAESSRNTEWRS
jgi:flagellar secretion chaperone FliS